MSTIDLPPQIVEQDGKNETRTTFRKFPNIQRTTQKCQLVQGLSLVSVCSKYGDKTESDRNRRIVSRMHEDWGQGRNSQHRFFF